MPGGAHLKGCTPAVAAALCVATLHSCAQLLLRAIQCSYKVLLARRADQSCAPAVSGHSQQPNMGTEASSLLRERVGRLFGEAWSLWEVASMEVTSWSNPDLWGRGGWAVLPPARPSRGHLPPLRYATDENKFFIVIMHYERSVWVKGIMNLFNCLRSLIK